MRRRSIMSRAAELLFDFIGVARLYCISIFGRKSSLLVCRTSEILFFFLLKTKKEQNCVHNDAHYC